MIGVRGRSLGLIHGDWWVPTLTINKQVLDNTLNVSSSSIAHMYEVGLYTHKLTFYSSLEGKFYVGSDTTFSLLWRGNFVRRTQNSFIPHLRPEVQYLIEAGDKHLLLYHTTCYPLERVFVKMEIKLGHFSLG